MNDKLTTAQMEKLTVLLRYIFQDIIEPADSELSIYQVVVNMLKQRSREDAETIDAALASVRESSELRALMHEKYHVTLEKYLPKVAQSLSDSEVAQVLEVLKQGVKN